MAGEGSKQVSRELLRPGAGAVSGRRLTALTTSDPFVEKLAESNFKLRTESYLQSIFQAAMVHRLNNVLTPMRGYAEMLHDYARSEKGMTTVPMDASAWLRVLHKNTQELEHLLTSMKLLSSIEDGTFEQEIGNVEIAPLMASVKDALSERASGKVIEYSGNANAFADERLLFYTLFTLVSDALRNTPAGGKVTVRVGESNGSTVLSITNGGDKIKQEEWVYLFCGQADCSQGIGVGLKKLERAALLSVPKQLTDEMDGAALSVGLAGSEIRVWLPAAKE